MSQLSIFVPINKIDEEQRLVYGQVAAEVLDNSGEMFDYAGSKPYFQKWSDNAHLTSGGKSKGNLRVMHTSKVAGVVTDLGFNDDDRVIEACAKVVDDSEWNMVKAGGYTGFSMGGRYVSRAEKSDGVKTYVADPVEISLVDKPCIPTATFSVVKADGVVEEHRFKEELYKSDEKKDSKGDYGDVKYADPGYQSDKKPRYPIDTAEHIRAAWSYINKEKNAGEYSSKQVSDIKSRIVAAWKEKIDKDGPPSAAKKSDNGDQNMYVPTNDEMLPVARALAKAAGKDGENDWVDFMSQARDELIAKNDPGQQQSEIPSETGDAPAQADEPANKADAPEHTDKDCKVENCDKCAATKADEADDKGENDDDGDETGEGDQAGENASKADAAPAPELQQGWQAKDGQFFLRKADAVAHNEALEKGTSEPSISDRLAGMVDMASRLAKGETIDDEPIPGFRDQTIAAIEGPLTKFEALAENDLVKGMYEVGRLASLLSSLRYVHSSVACEAAWEGDNSTVPGQMLDSLTTLGETLIQMTEEEVKEMLAGAAKEGKPQGDTADVDVSSIMELAASTLGLEKSALTEELAKRSPTPVDAPSTGDPDLLAKLDDATNRANEATAKAEGLETEMQKVVPLVEDLQKQLNALKALPREKAPTTRVVEKGSDYAGGAGGLTKADLEGKSEQELADMAIKMAHQRGQRIAIPRSGE